MLPGRSADRRLTVRRPSARARVRPIRRISPSRHAAASTEASTVTANPSGRKPRGRPREGAIGQHSGQEAGDRPRRLRTAGPGVEVDPSGGERQIDLRDRPWHDADRAGRPRVPELDRQRVQLNGFRRAVDPAFQRERPAQDGRDVRLGRQSRQKRREVGTGQAHLALQPAVGADQSGVAAFGVGAVDAQAQRRRQDPGPGQPAGLQVDGQGAAVDGDAAQRLERPRQRLGGDLAEDPGGRQPSGPLRTEQVDPAIVDRYPVQPDRVAAILAAQNVAPVGYRLPASAESSRPGVGGRSAPPAGCRTGAARRRPGRRAPRSPASAPRPPSGRRPAHPFRGQDRRRQDGEIDRPLDRHGAVEQRGQLPFDGRLVAVSSRWKRPVRLKDRDDRERKQHGEGRSVSFLTGLAGFPLGGSGRRAATPAATRPTSGTGDGAGPCGARRFWSGLPGLSLMIGRELRANAG